MDAIYFEDSSSTEMTKTNNFNELMLALRNDMLLFDFKEFLKRMCRKFGSKKIEARTTEDM